MNDLMKIKDMVAEILENVPETRDSDDILYLEVIRTIEPDAGNMSVSEFLIYRPHMGIPPFESVRRSRQKIQAENPDLCGKKKEEREEAMKAYYEFALTNGGDGHGKKT